MIAILIYLWEWWSSYYFADHVHVFKRHIIVLLFNHHYSILLNQVHHNEVVDGKMKGLP